MIARKKKLISIEQDHVAAGVTGNWNHQQIALELNWFAATYDLFHAQALCAVGSVHHSPAIESDCESLVIGDVILVREKQRAHAAEGIDLFDQLRRKARRIDQDVAAFFLRSND